MRQLRQFFQPLHGAELVYAALATIIVVVAIFALLHILPARWRKWMIIGSTFIAGWYYTLEFFIPAASQEKGNFLTPLKTPVGDWVQAIAGFTLAMGVTNLSLYHYQQIKQQRKGWYNSLFFFLSLVSMTIFGIWNIYIEGVHTKWIKTMVSKTYQMLFEGMLVPLDSTMFSILAFFIVSAAYRAFRIRTREAALMTIAAFLVMLSQVPLGIAITAWIPLESNFAFLRVDQIGHWILSVINMSAQRAITFGISVGFLAMSLRVWLSLERGAYFDQRV